MHADGELPVDLSTCRPLAFDATEWDDFLDAATIQRFTNGRRLFLEGEPADRVIALLNGRVKITVATPAGRDVLVALKGPGDLVGELASLDDGPRSATGITVEPVIGAVLSSAGFREFLESRPATTARLLRSFSNRIIETGVDVIERDGSDLAGRLARRLADLAARFGEHDGPSVIVRLGINQDELASWVGASRAAASRVLASFRDEGWLTTGRERIVINDLDALRERAMAAD